MARAVLPIGRIGPRLCPISRCRVPRASTWAFALGPRLKLRDPRFESGELGLRALKELFLNLEILAQNQVEPVEPCREQRPQVALDVLCRRIAQGLAHPLVQLLEQPLIDHGGLRTSFGRPASLR